MIKRGLIIILLISLLFVVLDRIVPMVSAVDDIDEAITEKEEEKKEKQGELEESQDRQYLYEQQGLTLSESLAALDVDIANLSAEVAAKEASLSELELRVNEQADVLTTAQGKVGSTSLSLYKVSRRSMVEILFSSEGMEDLLRQMGFKRYGVGLLLTKMRAFQSELEEIATDFNALSREVTQTRADVSSLQEQVATLEREKVLYQQMAADESSRQSQLIGEIANITAEQQQLIAQKMAASDTGTSVGEYEDASEELPTPPFTPAYAIASVGVWHRLGLSQYGAYGRSKAGQTYDAILAAYYTATLSQSYPVPPEIFVSGYGWMPFEDQYLKGIAEMPTYWAESGGYEALKAQAVIARSYALAYTNNGQGNICADTRCQVYYEPKVNDPAASEWHRAVAETRGQVLTDSAGNPIAAYYIMTNGGYTRLPADFDVGWGGYKEYLRRLVDKDAQGNAYDGPAHGDCPWYHKVWYCDVRNQQQTNCSLDGHPWLTSEEMIDLLNASLLPDTYNSNLKNPSLGGWSHEQVRSTLEGLGVTPISDISDFTLINNEEGYTATIVVYTSGGLREISGRRFYDVYRLRSRGNLWLKSGLFDIVVR